MKLALFDADDVLLNSLDEVAITGYNAYRIFAGATEDPVFFIEELPEGIRAKLEACRPRVKGPAELLAFMHLISEDSGFEERDIISDFPPEKEKRFKDILYGFRREMFMRNEEAFSKAVKTYGEACRQFKRLQETDGVDTYIVTNRDWRTIQQALLQQGIFIEETRILDGESGMSKKERIMSIIRKHALPEAVSYVDDNIDLLLSLTDIGIRLFIARWGCREKDRIAEAEEQGIIPLQQEEIVEEFLELI